MPRFTTSAPEDGWLARRSAGVRGFSLLELMVTVAIVAILGTLAAPSFQTLLQANKTRAVASELLASLNLARSEAARRGQPVSVCRSSDGSSCATNGTGWDKGWIVFVNEDGDSPAVVDSGELILQVRQNLPAGVTVRPNNNLTNFLTYSRTGLANQRGTFAICSGSAADPLAKRKPQAIVVIPTRAVLATDSNGDGIPEIDDGNGNLANLSSCENP